MKVIILSGCSGSGKSTFADQLRKDIGVSLTTLCSADNYFMVNGEYRFDASKLTEAHGACLRSFVMAIGGDSSILRHETIIVDNTNTTVEEIAPYYALAQAYGYEVELHTFHVKPEVAAARNTHGVPLVACEAMTRRIILRELPRFWKLKSVDHNITDS